MCAYAWHMETTLDGEQVLSDEGYSAFDEERWVPEPPKSKSRTAFERDRARLIHSSALRRLGAKSQILIAGTDDFASHSTDAYAGSRPDRSPNRRIARL